MKRIERIKTFILIILIFLSIFLSYKLWVDPSSYRLWPFINMSKWFESDEVDNIIASDIIVPEAILITEGEGTFIKLNPSEASFSTIWSMSKSILRHVNNTKNVDFLLVGPADWTKVTDEKSISINFNYILTDEILEMILDCKKDEIRPEFIGIKEIIITKTDDVEAVYVIKQEDDMIMCYKYATRGENIINDESVKNIFDNQELVKYSEFNSIVSNEKIKTRDDVFLPVFDAENKSRIKIKGIEFKNDIDITNYRQIEILVNTLFKGTDFAKFTQKDGTLIYISEKNDIIKIYDNGMLEFEVQERDKSLIGDINLRNAIKIVLDKMQSVGLMNNMFITKISKDGENYNFKLDYMAYGVKIVNANEPYYDNPIDAINVSVNINTGTMKCTRLVLEYNLLKEYELLQKNDKILNFIQDKVKEAKDNVTIKDISLVYVANNEKSQSNNIIIKLPVWLVKYEIDGVPQAKTISAVQIGG